jgi:hypothetical protein
MTGLVTCDAAIPARLALGAGLAAGDRRHERSITWVHVSRANDKHCGKQQVAHVILPLPEAAAARIMSPASYGYRTSGPEPDSHPFSHRSIVPLRATLREGTPMTLSVTFCRTQEARQLAHAQSAPLENSRIVARDAAMAWAKEAAFAERSDARRLRNATVHQTVSRLPNAEDRALSENPDRGFA